VQLPIEDAVPMSFELVISLMEETLKFLTTFIHQLRVVVNDLKARSGVVFK
jgi:hypothetical protein